MRRSLALLVLLAAAAGAHGQASKVALRGQSDQTYERLAAASRQLVEGKAAEATDAFLRIMDEAGDDLVSPDGVEYRTARQVAQQYLARMSADVLKGYRLRVNAPAARLLAQGKSRRDPGPLRELVDRYFVSRPAEEALLLLGELAFERGEFRAAEHHWRRLLPAEEPTDLTYPDPSGDAAAVGARVILAVIFQQEPERARSELDKYRKTFPRAAGHLAGRDGLYVETLQALLDRPPVLAAAGSGGGEWTALGGSATRSGRTTARLPRYWPGAPTWRAPIPVDRGRSRPAYTPVSPSRSLGFHPVVLDGIAYIADAVRVFAFDLRTGELAHKFDLRDQAAVKRPDVTVDVPIEVDADFTLTAADGRLYARLGSPAIAPTQPDTQPPASYLVGFSPSLQPQWFLTPPVTEGVAAVWEGSPVVVDGRLYAAFARFEENRTIHAIACYGDPPAKPLWVVDVCDGPELPRPTDSASEQEVRYRQQVLTQAGHVVVYCSHDGVVAAADVRTGKLAWALRYPKSPRPMPPRDLNPPVADGGRVFVAPTDSDRLYALDAETGRVLWEIGTTQVDQFLGVARGRLVCTIAGPNRGIRGFSVTSGSDREPDGWAVHDDGRLQARGRGLVSDEFVLFPTSSASWGLRILDLATGENVRPPLPRLHGNLAYADGVLLAATPTELWGYVTGQTGLDDRRSAAGQLGGTFTARRRALALAETGNWSEALATLDGAAPALDPARTRAEWQADRAEQAIASGQIDEARKLLRESLGAALPVDWRARAAGRLLALEPSAGGVAAADRFLAGLGQPAEFADAWVRGPDGVPARLRDLVSRHYGAPPPQTPPVIRSAPVTPDPTDIGLRHRLDEKAEVDRETRFPSARCVPLRSFAGESGLPGLAADDPLLLLTDGGRVLAIPPREADPRWVATLPEDTAVTHAAVVDNSVLVAGPRGVLRLRHSDGDRIWTFRLPDADPLPESASRPIVWTAGGPLALPTLSSFAVAGSRLIARVGDHHLLALDLATGSVAWVRAAAGDGLTAYPSPTGPRFTGPPLVDGEGLLVQLSNGSRWSIDAGSGQVTHAAPTALVPWAGPPVRLDSGRVAVADGPGLVRGLEADPSRLAWVMDAGGEASLTGSPPQLAPVRDGLIVAVARNHGVEIERLLGAGGTRAWRDHGPALLPVGELDLADAGTDLVSLYLPAEGMLTALRMTDGRNEWATDLAAAVGGQRVAWKVFPGRRSVVTVPTEPVAAEPFAMTPAVVSFAHAPGVWRVPGLALALYDGWARRTVPVLVFDPESGTTRRRLDLPAVGPVLAVHLGPGVAVVVTAGRAYWLK